MRLHNSLTENNNYTLIDHLNQADIFGGSS